MSGQSERKTKTTLEAVRAANYIVRQDRIAAADLNLTLKLKNHVWPVFNYSAFGIAVVSPEDFIDKDSAVQGSLLLDDIEIDRFDLHFVRQEKLNDGLNTIAFEILSHPLNTEKVSVYPELTRIFGEVLQEQKRLEQVPIEFKYLVYQVKDVFVRLEDRIKRFSVGRSFLSMEQTVGFEETIIEVVGRRLYEIWQACHKQLSDVSQNLSDDVLKEAFLFFREQLRHHLYQSTFATRSLTKPRGYAGDFEMMNLIYRQENVGHTLFSRCVEKAFQIHPEPEAVRNRVDYLYSHIVKTLKKSKADKITIMSVASGPAMEVQHLIENLPQEELDRLHITLLDQDEGSLKYAQLQIRKKLKSFKKSLDIVYQRENIKDLFKKGLSGTFDLIYSAGLFDYFTDPVAHSAAKLLLQFLNQNGTCVIGNFDISTPNRFGMGLIFDWHLIYRSKGDLERIFNFPGTFMRIEQENKGINLFCVIDK